MKHYANKTENELSNPPLNPTGVLAPGKEGPRGIGLMCLVWVRAASLSGAKNRRSLRMLGAAVSLLLGFWSGIGCRSANRWMARRFRAQWVLFDLFVVVPPTWLGR